MRIAAARTLKRAGMSQARIAKELGVAQAAVSKYLSKRYSKKTAKAVKLIEATGLQEGVVALIRAKRSTKRILQKIDEVSSTDYILKEVKKLIE